MHSESTLKSLAIVTKVALCASRRSGAQTGEDDLEAKLCDIVMEYVGWSREWYREEFNDEPAPNRILVPSVFADVCISECLFVPGNPKRCRRVFLSSYLPS